MASDDLLRAGMQAFRQHHLERAQSKFAQAIVADPNSEHAWLWLGRVIADPERRLYCYQRVLEINPRNPDASQAFQYVAASMRPASVRRALAIANPRPVTRDSTVPILSPRQSPAPVTPAVPSRPRAMMPAHLLLNVLLILVFLSVYIAYEWYNVTTDVQNAVLTPALLTTATAAPTPMSSPRSDIKSMRASDALFAQTQRELDAKNAQSVVESLLPNLDKLTESDDLANAYYLLGRAELDLERYGEASGYFKKLYALEPSVQYLFLLAVSYDWGGDSTAAIEQYSALLEWNGREALGYHGLAERRISDIKRLLATPTPTATR